MKKYLFALILCSFYCLNAKTVINSNKPLPNIAVSNTQYPDYYQSIEARYLSNTNDWTTDGANGTIEITNNNLIVNFDPSWTYGQHITTGVIAYINIYPALPTIELGPIYGNGQETGYYAKIEDNNLVVYTPNNYSGVYYTSLYFGISIDLNCAKTWYKDMDGDGFGDPNSIAFTDCYQPNYNYVDNNLDCNDQNNTITEMRNWYVDADNDGYGAGLDQNPVASCQKPSFGNYASNNLDCDDSNSTIKSATVWYVDTDNDGFGDLDAEPITSCTKPTGNYATNKLDSCPTEPYPSNNGCQPTINDMDENYIYVVSPTIPSTSIDGLLTDQKTEEITYFDGLGRPMQKIGIAAGGDGEDIITHLEYDNFGRQEKEYMPYTETSNAGLIRTGDIPLATKNFYNTSKYENTTNPYSQKEFEASSLNRVLKQAAPGTDWALGAGHEIRLDYQINTTADQVRRFGVSFIAGNKENPDLKDNGIYEPSQLYKTITKDENWQANQTNPNDHTTEEFKDKKGDLVLKRTFDAGKWHDTYYVYDDYGNLTYVLPPKFLTYSSITQPFLGKGVYRDQDINFFTSEGNGCYVSISQYTENTLVLSLSVDGLNPGPLKSGKIADFDFPANFSLSIPFGNIMVLDINGNYVLGGTAYLQNGALYFTSNGTVAYPDNEGMYNFNATVNLSNYQAQYALPTLDRSTFNDLVYQYRYDKRNRLIEKKLPGKGTATDWEEIVYNKLDQPILTRDPNLKAQNKWLFTKYDVFGRVAYTGLINNSSSRSVLQSNADGTTTQYVSKSTTSTTIAGTTIYYSNDTAVYPSANISELHSINYYDDYTFDNDGITLPQTSLGKDIINYNNAAATQKLTKGLPTGTKIRVLDPFNAFWITTVTGYDAKARAIYSVKKNNYLFTNDILQSKLDFVGKVEKTIATHTKKTSSGTVLMNVVTEDIFTYDQVGRLKKQTQVINGSSPEIIVDNTYDELGQLTSKKVGGKTSTGLQKVDYAYNIRGWLKNINNPNDLGQDLFGFGVNYNKLTNQNSPLYNGNISNISWKTNNGNSNLKEYNYRYDVLNRFKRADYAENNIFNNYFYESINGYDRNGNITGLSRNAQNTNSNYAINIDYLNYSYDNGNKLLKVQEINSSPQYAEGFKNGNNTDDDYSYDGNGNMTEDKNKGITAINYNYINLPTKITFATGTIDYVYDATGVKQRKIVSSGNTTDYAGGFQYENNVLKFFPQPEGYVEYNSGNFNYIYQYKDHLGNTRLSYSDSNNDGTITTPYTYQTVWEDGFENGTGWDGTGASWGHALDAFDTTVKHSGNRSGRIDIHNEDPFRSRAVHSTEWIPINNSVDTQYRVSGWFFIQNIPQYSRGRLELMMKKAGETEYMTLYEYKPVTIKGQWVFMEMTITVPAYIKSLNSRIAFDYNTASTTGSAWYDDLKIEKVTANSQNEIIAENNYYPFGLKHKDNNNVVNSTNPALRYMYNGKELQDENIGGGQQLSLYDYGARNYDPAIGRWMNIDPLTEKFVNQSPFNYTYNNPIFFIDPDGREPIRPQAGTSQGFINFLNNTRSRMGTLVGASAHDAMMRLGKTEMNWSHMRPEPMTTNPFNTSRDKYIYTTSGGWLDMSHFMFYAGRAYDYKIQRDGANKAINEMKKNPQSMQGINAQLIKDSNMDPVGEAVQDGYRQEMTDRVVAGHSAYSYEDLPSDKFGADFGANYFNPESEMTLGEQLQNYLNTMGATIPNEAPNFSTLPVTDEGRSAPTRTNHTTTPVYVNYNP